MSLPKPELLVEALSIHLFAEAVSKSASQLVNTTEATNSQYLPLKAYFEENIDKLEAAIDHVKVAIG